MHSLGLHLHQMTWTLRLLTLLLNPNVNCIKYLNNVNTYRTQNTKCNLVIYNNQVYKKILQLNFPYVQLVHVWNIGIKDAGIIFSRYIILWQTMLLHINYMYVASCFFWCIIQRNRSSLVVEHEVNYVFLFLTNPCASFPFTFNTLPSESGTVYSKSIIWPLDEFTWPWDGTTFETD